MKSNQERKGLIMAEVTYADGDHNNEKQKKIHDEVVKKSETREKKKNTMVLLSKK